MLSPTDRAALLAHARAAVHVAAAGRDQASPGAPAGASALAASSGAFVTLHAADGSLRGCIGYIEPRRALWETVWDAAHQAAVSDPRFPPVAPGEVAGLGIEISVLGALQAVTAANLSIGTHGIVVSRGPRRGLLLPQVATEHGWDVDQFLKAGCEKAGLPPASARDGTAKIEIFTAEVFRT